MSVKRHGNYDAEMAKRHGESEIQRVRDDLRKRARERRGEVGALRETIRLLQTAMPRGLVDDVETYADRLEAGLIEALEDLADRLERQAKKFEQALPKRGGGA